MALPIDPPVVRSDLASTLQVQYGTFTFGPATEVVGFKTRPIQDRAGRTFIALEHVMTLKFWLNAFDPNNDTFTLDLNMPAIRAQLMRPADRLVINSSTFGDYTINAGANIEVNTTGTTDLIWGPKPQLLDQKGFNSYGACCIWEVRFCLDPCGGNVQGKILEWNYGVDFHVDGSGYTTRTIKGTVSIPLTRKSQEDRTLADQADRLRDSILQGNPIPFGFRRKDQDFPLSEDKRTLNYNLVDEQMPNNIPPPFVVGCEASHHVETDPRTFAITTHTIRASYELTLGRNRREAWTHFQKLFGNRVTAGIASGWTFLPMKLHLGEPEIYGRKSADFSLTYKMMRPAAPVKPSEGVLANLLAVMGGGVVFFNATGLYQAAPESNWQAWKDSMVQAKVFDPRGTAQLKFQTSDDVIVDLCLGTPAPVKTLGPAIRTSGSIRSQNAVPAKINPLITFLDYQLWMEIRQTDNVVALQTLPTAPVGYEAELKSAWDITGYEQPYAQQLPTPGTIVQYRGAPLTVLTLWGSAIRAGYDITPPQLVSSFDQRAIPFNDQTCGFRSAVVANWGAPIVAAQWKFRYVLAQPFIGTATAPINPVTGGTPDGVTEAELQGFVTG